MAEATEGGAQMTAILAAVAWLRSSWIGKAVAAALALLAAVALIRHDARQDERRDREIADAKAREKSQKDGLDAQMDERRAGGNADDILTRMRERDGQWRR